MTITLVKKRLASGEPCPKCVKAEALLADRGALERIDRVLWAEESDPGSPGWELAALHGVETAPFFVVEDARGTRVYTSTLAFLRAELTEAPAPRANDEAPPPVTEAELSEAATRLGSASPREILAWGAARFGPRLVLAFSGAEDVALLELSAELGQPLPVFVLDTGRLHGETLAFIERARRHYGVELEVWFPDRVAVEDLVRRKGLESFYEDGHQECCGIRKVEPLRRALAGRRAWATGQRRDQSPTRSALEPVEWDTAHAGAGGRLVKLNPFCHWTLAELWAWLRARGAPTNPLHERGYVSIGCEPCTRALRPGEHERAARWWWEEATRRECGLHGPR